MLSLGMLAGLLSVVASFIYIYEIFYRGVMPERASWFVWTTILVISFLGQRAVGAQDSLWFAFADIIGCALILFISLWRGKGGFTKFDIICVSLAMVGVIVWQSSGAALAAILGSIFADMMGSLPTIRKGYLEPETEGISIFALHVIAAAIAVVAAKTLDPLILIAPVYIGFANAAVVAAILLGRNRKARLA